MGAAPTRGDSRKMDNMCRVISADESTHRSRVRDIECVHFSKDGVPAAYLHVWTHKPVRTRYQTPRCHMTDVMEPATRDR